jgi:hypothetical protein
MALILEKLTVPQLATVLSGPTLTREYRVIMLRVEENYSR